MRQTIMLGCLLALGCGGKAAPTGANWVNQPTRGELADGETPTKPSSSDAAGPGTASDEDDGPAEPAGLPRAEAEALLTQWLEAQNSGDFPAYEQLFAADFTGVLRVGAKAVPMDRATWMKSRGQMFKRKMKVEARDVTIHSEPARATLLLIQRFESGRFSDEGPKRLVIAQRGDQLLIVSEEMLDSKLIATSFRPAGSGDVDLDKVAKTIAVELFEKYKGQTKSLRAVWGRRYGADDALMALLYKSPLDENGLGVMVFAIADRSGQLLGSQRDSYGRARRGPDYTLHALPDRDYDGDGHPELAVIMKSGGLDGDWGTLALFSSKRPTLLTLEYYSWAGEESASGYDLRYGCVTTIAERLVIIALMRAQEWDSADSPPRNSYRVALIGSPNSKLFAVEIERAEKRSELVDAWRRAAAVREGKPWDVLSDSNELRDLRACPAGADSPLVVYKSVLARTRGPRYRLLRTVTWDRKAAEKVAAKSGGRLVELGK